MELVKPQEGNTQLSAQASDAEVMDAKVLNNLESVEMTVKVVDVPRHDFAGTGKEALKAAEKWAKENIGEDDIRRPENGYNPSNLIHRFYGHVVIDGDNYRVKTTIVKSSTGEAKTKPHSFEVTEIELLPEDNNSKLAPMATGYQDRLPHGTAKLLQGVEKSYDAGVKLLDASADATQTAMEGDVRMMGHV